MPREGDRSTPLWQKTTYTVYLRIAIIVASGLALTAAAIALNTALHKQEDDDPATIAGNDVEENPDSDSERRNGANILRETIGSLIAATSATILIQTMLILVTKFSPYIYEPAGSTHLCIQLVDFIIGCLLLAGCTVSTVASGMVAHQLAFANNEESENSMREDLFKAVTGSTAFGILSVVLLTALCILNSCTLYSLKKYYNRTCRRHKIANITSV